MFPNCYMVVVAGAKQSCSLNHFFIKSVENGQKQPVQVVLNFIQVVNNETLGEKNVISFAMAYLTFGF